MRRTDAITVTVAKSGSKPRTFTMPASLGHRIETLMRKLERGGPSIPASLVLPELADDVLRPASTLRGARYRESMTQVDLAARLAIRQSHLSEMENGKRPIGKNMARKLANIFKCDFRVFL